ncbi:MAG: aldehyde dehydrogenase, partial [Pirellulaceae bacterium]
MIHLQPLRWGKPYKSLEIQDVVHFDTGEPIAKIGQVNGGMVQMDIRKADNARTALRKLSPDELLQRIAKAADLFESGTLTVGDSQQTVEDFVHQQSASTG